ncbi:MAG: hypothetical protein JO332_16675 [Planctomycetaceae bacterium]|nr:hypothetical protein [Planctomycetaceae bacterium]
MDSEISRRKALGLVGASVAAAGLNSCDDRSKAAETYSKDALTKKTEEILDFATSDRFMDELKAVIETPKAKQLDEAAKRFAPERLAELGLKLPANTRISSRVFDETSSQARVLGDEKAMTPSQTPVAGAAKPVAINLSLPPASVGKGQVQSLIDKPKVLSNREIVAAGICVCVGGGACVGIGG